MKITTEHTRTGIGKVQRQTGFGADRKKVGDRQKMPATRGILYDNPEQEEEEKKNGRKDRTGDRVADKVAEAGESARRLYQIFLDSKIKLQKQEDAGNEDNFRIITYVAEDLMQYVIKNMDYAVPNSYIRKPIYDKFRLVWENVRRQKHALIDWLDKGVVECLYDCKFSYSPDEAISYSSSIHTRYNAKTQDLSAFLRKIFPTQDVDCRL